jgi:hypothetical protein
LTVLVFYNIDPSTRTSSTLSDNSSNDNNLSITLAPYKFNSYFDFEDHRDSIIQGPINNVGGVLDAITINFWFFIKYKNIGTLYQPILVMGDVDTGNNSITLKIRRLNSNGFRLHFNHFPTDIVIPEADFVFYKHIWYNVIFTKSILGVYSYHIHGNIVPVYSQTDDRVITIPANTTLSFGKDWSRLDRELHWTRLGLVSIYELNQEDSSGNENELVEVGLQEIEYVNDKSIKFSTPNNNMVTNLHILHKDIENTVNRWILVNKQINSSVEKQRIFTIGTGETSEIVLYI